MLGGGAFGGGLGKLFANRAGSSPGPMGGFASRLPRGGGMGKFLGRFGGMRGNFGNRFKQMFAKRRGGGY